MPATNGEIGARARLRSCVARLLVASAVLLVAGPATSALASSGHWERAWGIDVDGANPGAAFEVCTVAASCKPGAAGAPPGIGGQLLSPADVASDGAGNVYVSTPDNRIQKFDAAGNFLRAWGQNVDAANPGTGFEICTVAANCRPGLPGIHGGEMSAPDGVATDPSGNVYVADRANNRIQKFDAAGNFLRTWGIDVDSGGGTGFEICTVALACRAGTPGVPPGAGGGLQSPSGVATDGAGNVYVSDQQYRIQKFDSAGNFLRAWGKDVDAANPGSDFEICTVAADCQSASPGGGGGELDLPAGLATDPSGNVYVADQANNRIQKFDSAGNFMRAWGKDVNSSQPGNDFEACGTALSCQAGQSGGLGGEMNSPADIAVDATGGVYVADRTNNRIQKFDLNGTFSRTWGRDVDNGTPGGGYEVCTFAPYCKAAGAGRLGGELASPSGLATDSTGDLYVADNANNRVQKFDTAETQWVLSVARAGAGSGTVTGVPTGIDCGATCSHSYASGTAITLTATADPGSGFSGWSGAGCSGTGTCQVTLNADTIVTASFTPTRSISSIGTPVTEDFDTLAATGTVNTSLPRGVMLDESGSGADDAYAADDGRSFLGNTYSYGTGLSSDRALGSVKDASVASTYGIAFTNNTGATVDRLSISYTGEDWYGAVPHNSDRLAFLYSLDATSLANGSWTSVPLLDFYTPNVQGGQQNGNDSNARKHLTATLTNLSIPDGAMFVVRWIDWEWGPGSDAGLAVDDFSITAVTDCGDGVDNDSDGAVDYPADPGCTDAADDDEANPTVSIVDQTVTEGDTGTTAARFVVALSGPASAPVSVHYETADGTAFSGLDYASTTGTLSFQPGQTTKPITVPVTGDLIDEPTETYGVALSAPSGAAIADGNATGRIRDDDPAPTISVRIPAMRPEGVGQRFTVVLSNPSSKPVSVRYATADLTATAPGDYTAKSRTLKFQPGWTAHTVVVKTVDDALPESSETFALGLTSPKRATIGDATGVATVLDND